MPSNFAEWGTIDERPFRFRLTFGIPGSRPVLSYFYLHILNNVQCLLPMYLLELVLLSITIKWWLNLLPNCLIYVPAMLLFLGKYEVAIRFVWSKKAITFWTAAGVNNVCEKNITRTTLCIPFPCGLKY